jgi:hypothetical protein
MIIEGVLDDWFETGLEGTVWVIQENGLSGFDGLHIINKGDHLKITASTGETVFDGIIEPETAVGDDGKRMGRHQPTSCGRWIHWFQRGFDPDVWGNFFFSGGHRALLNRSDSR